MFTAMPFPIFRDEAAAAATTTTTLPSFNFTASSPYRPTNSSPLSSSPIAATAYPPSPLSPRDPNARREVQSSPIRETGDQCYYNTNNNNNNNNHPGSINTPSIFTSKFASRPARPSPLNQKREAAQESRRKLFLKNVRQRAEDKRWEMRGGEQELLKLEWFSLNRDLRSAKNADLDGLVLDSDIEEAARLREEMIHRPQAALIHSGGEDRINPEEEMGYPGVDADAMMVDMLEQEQQAELEAMAASILPQQQPSSSMEPPGSPHWSDDDEYDAIFMDYLSREGQDAAASSSGEMDLS